MKYFFTNDINDILKKSRIGFEYLFTYPKKMLRKEKMI